MIFLDDCCKILLLPINYLLVFLIILLFLSKCSETLPKSLRIRFEFTYGYRKCCTFCYINCAE